MSLYVYLPICASSQGNTKNYEQHVNITNRRCSLPWNTRTIIQIFTVLSCKSYSRGNNLPRFFGAAAAAIARTKKKKEKKRKEKQRK